MSYGSDSEGLGAFFFILIVVGVIASISYSKCSGGDHINAEKEFSLWAKSLDLKYEHATCNNHDGDGDGYVSCTYTLAGELRTVECAGSWTMQSGCREPKMRAPSSN